MAAWAKFKFFYETMLGSAGATLTATSTESSGDYDVDYLYNMLETNRWKAEDSGLTDPQYIAYDAGAGNTKTADYLAILGHNLNTIGASAVLQNSNDNFVANVNNIIAVRPLNDLAFVLEARIVVNGDVEVWTNGASSAPDGWTLTGGTIARDAVNFKSGSYGVALTRSGTNTAFFQNIQNYTYYKSKTVTFGAWIKTSVAGQAGLRIGDGVGSSVAYHTGGGDWEWVTVTRTMDSSATLFKVNFIVETTDGTAYFDKAVAVEGSSVSSIDESDCIQPSSGAKRYWRLKIAGFGSAPPEMAICVWGDKTELDYATASFDPYEQEEKAKVNLSYGGYVTGVHKQYTERRLNLRIDDADSVLYGKVKTWWETHGLKNLFVAWETANNPSDVWLMRQSPKFRNPFNRTGLYRDINIQLTGRKE
jgi:hypothetical protein